MNFKIFDDEFDENKKEYLQEITKLQKRTISVTKKDVWENFVNKVLVDTRSYYILIYALKVMINLDDKNLAQTDKFYDNALVQAMSFMPDKEFMETAILIVAKFHKEGINLAKSQNVDIISLLKQAKENVEAQKVQKTKN